MQENEIDVLFVDDDSSFLKQAKIFLEDEDGRLNVDTFTSAAKALDEVRKKDYFAIVSDYQMPEMDGLEFLKTLREELNNEVFFIVLTGKGREEVAMNALNLGADRYLLKTGDPSSQYDKLADMIFNEVERRRSEEIIERYKQDLESVFDALREIAFVEDEDHNILMANEATSNFLGNPKEELEGQKCYELFHSLNEPIEGCPVEEILGTGELCESEFYDEDRDKYFLARAYPFTESEGKKRFIHQLIDITDRKEMEEELKQRNKAIKSALDGFSITNLNREIFFVNSSFLEIWGYENKDEVMGVDIIDFWEDEDEFREVWNEIKEEGRWRGVLQGKKRGGENFPVEASASLVRDEEGESIGVTFSFEDITERKESEEREEFLHSLLRHDLRNKLVVEEGYLDLLKDYDFSEEAGKFLTKALNANREASNLIENVRKLREVEEEELEEVDIDKVLEGIVSEFKKEAAEKGVNIRYNSCECEAKAGDLVSEVFSNLVKNSIQHSGGNMIKIQTQEEENKIIVTVEDDGRGISDEVKGKIFQRGYKEGENAGSGLGMHLVKEIVENYDGSVEVKDSELGGARFDVYLQNF